ncbi:6-N-hydroxylaminopurine resistance protein [Leisingera aquaemixtae]|uniref:6-N-hydroxylaminopurine resistance protein n=2 Tax=Leisingera aquaemixtae TaxID=1396826 RepID=A0A0N7M5E4_9RHOB|nr:6-N-hydroxylaminopurine resistance protein [Leisingera aquaemixtae]
MQVLALSVARPVEIEYGSRKISTGFYKSAVEGPRMVRETNIDGDQQADLTVHGGPHKAVYAFPAEHYEFYQNQLGQSGYAFGHFGENLTTEGMLETEVRIGDRYQIGEALLEVSQPRSPCFKFGIRMGVREAIKTCLASARTGFYFRVISEGSVEAGDAIELAHRDNGAPSVTAVHNLYYHEKLNEESLVQAVGCQALAPGFKDEFIERLKILQAK